jgi:hypothetical protein
VIGWFSKKFHSSDSEMNREKNLDENFVFKRKNWKIKNFVVIL